MLHLSKNKTKENKKTKKKKKKKANKDSVFLKRDEPFHLNRPINIDTFANSTDPDELSHQDLYCLPFCYWFSTETPICNYGCVHIRRWKSLSQKLGGEKVNTQTPNCLAVYHTKAVPFHLFITFSIKICYYMG